jgi:L-asparagine oxygenase
VAREVVNLVPGQVDTQEFVSAARDGWDRLPVDLRQSIRRCRRHSGPSCRLLVRGLRVDEDQLGATPSVAGSAQREASLPAALLFMVACGLGDPVAFLPEKSGALVQNVVPVPGQENFQGNVGSVPLSFHVESAFHVHRPDYVILVCPRADHEGVAGTRTACIREVLPLLSDASREALFQPAFVTAAPGSFGPGLAGTAPHAVLSGTSEDPDLRVDLAATRALTPAGAAALGELGGLFERLSATSQLRAGTWSSSTTTSRSTGAPPSPPGTTGVTGGCSARSSWPACDVPASPGSPTGTSSSSDRLGDPQGGVGGFAGGRRTPAGGHRGGPGDPA